MGAAHTHLFKGKDMGENTEAIVTRTTADVVFDQLHEEILTLKLLPGARISEAEVANRLGVSRQPVRDAFNRLGNLNLLLVRPQRATKVCGFSWEKIENARFIRLAVELEVARRAHSSWDDTCTKVLGDNLDLQRAAIDASRIDQFHSLDYDFHKLICTLGGTPLAFDTMMRCKQQVDRLCVLSLEKSEEVTAVLSDHQAIADAFQNGTAEDVEKVFRLHLSRLDGAIKEIHEAHSEYFE